MQGVPMWVDAAQALGHLDAACGADLVYATSRKWLPGPRGVGVLAVAQPWWGRLRVASSPLARARLAAGCPRLRLAEPAEGHVAGRVGLCAAVRQYLQARPQRVRERLAEVGAPARAWAADTGAVLVHPYDDPHVIAGQGTVGLEILDQGPQVATVVVPCGGGGLLSGIAAAVKAARTDVRLVGVQANRRRRCRPRWLPGIRSPGGGDRPDGIAVSRPGDLTLAHVIRLADEVVTVPDEVILEAVLVAAERARLVAEPAGAAGIAAVMREPGAFKPPVVVVVSGTNIDPAVLGQALRIRVAADGRYVVFRARIADRLGALCDLLATVARTGINVLNVGHVRAAAGLGFGEAEVEIRAQAQGRQHAVTALGQLRKDASPRPGKPGAAERREVHAASKPRGFR
jgi:hypothetical protein